MVHCTYTVPDKNASGDNFYGASICSQVYVDYFWRTYGFQGNKAYWDEGFGWDDPCNTDQPLARAFNGCYALTYSANDYQNDAYSGACLNWARRYVREHIDDLRSMCGDGSAIASYSGGTVELYLGFFYSKNAPGRAETLLHESRHSAKSHDAKFPAGSTFGAGKDGADSSLGIERRLDVRRPVSVVVLRTRCQDHQRLAAAGPSARERGDRRGLRDASGLQHLTLPRLAWPADDASASLPKGRSF